MNEPDRKAWIDAQKHFARSKRNTMKKARKLWRLEVGQISRHTYIYT
jgi:hypothetical protein